MKYSLFIFTSGVILGVLGLCNPYIYGIPVAMSGILLIYCAVIHATVITWREGY